MPAYRATYQHLQSMMLCHSSHLVHIRSTGKALLPGECANIAVATSCKTHHTHSQKCGLLLMQAGDAASAVRWHSGVVVPLLSRQAAQQGLLAKILLRSISPHSSSHRQAAAAPHGRRRAAASTPNKIYNGPCQACLQHLAQYGAVYSPPPHQPRLAPSGPVM